MGEDVEAVSPSNLDKPSSEGTSEQLHSIREGKLNGGESEGVEQCELLPKLGDTNASDFDSENSGELGGEAGRRGVDETGDVHVADDAEGEMEAGEEVGGGGPGPGYDLAAVNEEDHVEVQDGPVVATEGVGELSARTDFKEGATAADGGGGSGGEEKNDYDAGIVDMSDADKLITESGNLQSTATEEDAEMVGKPVESSVVMAAARNELEPAEGKETNSEEMLITEVKVDSKQEMKLVGGKEGTEVLESLGSNGLQYTGQELVILVDEKVNNSVLEEKESEMEDINIDNLDSLHKPDDADAEMVAEDDCAVTDMGVETETDAVEEKRVLAMGKEVETETVEVVDTDSNPTGDGKLVSPDEDEKIVAKEEEPAFIGSEMEIKTDAEEEPRTLVIEQGEVVEAKIDEVGEEDGEPVAEAGSTFDDLEMETQTSAGEQEQGLQTLEKENEAEAEDVEVDNVEHIPEMDDVNHVAHDEADEEMAAEESALVDTEETETEGGESGRIVGEKHKRGTAKGLTKSKTSSKSQKITEEDVCFICFDGGDLFLCDRRGCPKAYHPSCVNRDEAFFRSKGRWNCGWHICNLCKKTAHYMCYTCPYSLCKGCAKDGVIMCVRGNKGFCETCMRTVMLIENNSEGQIDFDDKSSWEFLFKDYYTDLKSKLSLTLAEINKAKNPWKGSEVSTSKEESPETPVANKDAGGSGNEAKNSEGAKQKKKKVKKRARSLAEEEELADVAIPSPSNEEWASKELLEFVMHMKNGDRSVVSQFDVQALLLEYIKRNKLRDPRRKSQIICDSRLEHLFGKPRVGHFEMLKLLESHFLVKEDAHTDDVQGSVVDTEVNQLEVDENDDNVTKGTKDKKRKIRRKTDKGPLSNRLDYAAIDIHNISLIYLRRKLMEDILEDGDDFQNKVTGTFVRIRISGNTQKHDLYRLVQVVGTSKAAETYKLGKRSTDLMLEILNLNKTELVSIDTISNQDFTEEECKRLRTSIKCGLLNTMTVGDILDKAMELQAVRVNDWLESEIQRLSHLRDRASDMGRRKELRECVEKLQILKTPEERLRRLEEVPKIHADPKMDPNNESEEDDSETDDNRQEGLLRTTGSGFARRGRAPISPGTDFSPKDSWSGGNISSKSWESNKNVFSKTLPNSGEDVTPSDMVNNNASWNQGRERAENKSNLSSSSKSEVFGLNSDSMARSESLSGATLVNSSVSLPAKEVENVVKINETQKVWYYKDPSGKVQGPFSMTQLRKWSNTGYFPGNLRIWRTGEKQDDSVLLTDALAGRFAPKKESSGDNKLSTAVSFDATQGSSGHYVNSSDTPLQQLSREETFAERSNIEPNRGLQMLQMGALKGSLAPSVEVPKPPTEKWTRSDLSNLPSPTPIHNNAGELGDHGRTLLGGASYAEGKQSPASALSHHGNVSSVTDSVLITKEQLLNGRENGSISAIGAAHALQGTSLTQIAEARASDDHGHHLRAQDSTTHAIQLVSSQNSHIETHGWGGPPPAQKVESNPLTPVPGQQQQAYNQWGVVTPPAQNPTGKYSNSGPSPLPQPEFWGPPAQSNQPNMQTPTMPNVGWGTGHAETNSSAPALRPENPNTGWVTMQANPNMGWVAAPGQAPTNMNWTGAVQAPAPPPGNTNPGWIMPTGDAGQGHLNPGWIAPAVPSGVQGLPVGGAANTGWVAPPPANMGPAVQGPAPVTGWGPGPMGSGNHGAPPVHGGAPSGNPNQGWGAPPPPPPPGNQGPWGGPDKYQGGGGNFSGQRDNNGGSHGGDSGYGGGRPWNRQSSFGRRTDLRNIPRDVLCPYNTHGRCRKGNRCNYIHS